MHALQPASDVKRPGRTLTAEELESALELLSTEAAPAAARGGIRQELFEDILFAGVAFGLPAGLLVILVEPWLGLGLLALAGLSLVLFWLAPENNWDADIERFKSSLGGSVRVAQESWISRTSWLEILVFLGQAFLVLGGGLWLVVGLITEREVVIPALVAAGLGMYWFWVTLAFDRRRELQYYEQVDSIRQRLEGHASSSAESEEQVAVSGAELDVLARAEGHQTKLAVTESARQVASVLERSYAVSMTLEAIQELEEFHESDPTEWLRVENVIRALQDDPRPSSAVPVTAPVAALKLAAGRHAVRYVLDEQNRNVTVVGIDLEPSSESTDDE